MAVSVRLRFEVFKRDEFMCGYCGRKSPDVVLEVDHIVPICDGGQDDAVNPIASCWECNRGKAGIPLAAVMTGEDPHDKAIELLEKTRQLEEYNKVLAAERERRETEVWRLVEYWQSEKGAKADPEKGWTISTPDYRWLFSALVWCPSEIVLNFMDVALQRRMTKNLRYVAACCRNWRYEHQAHKDIAWHGFGVLSQDFSAMNILPSSHRGVGSVSPACGRWPIARDASRTDRGGSRRRCSRMTT